MHRQIVLIGCGCLVFATIAVAAEEQRPLEHGRTPELREKGSALMMLIEHQINPPSEEIASIVRRGLHDINASVRELALAAVVSRAGGPHFSQEAPVLNDWVADRSAMQGLRSEVTAALQDQAVNVRLQAVSALASLDYDLPSGEVHLHPDTISDLVRQFNLDKSPSVRAKIVSGFGTDRDVNSEAVRGTIQAAFSDVDARVRHAATAGAAKLGTRGDELLIGLLSDSNRSVRLQAIASLASEGSGIAEYLERLKSVLANERDPEVLTRLRSLVEAVSKQ